MKSCRMLEIINFVINLSETLVKSRISQNAFTRNRKMSFKLALYFMLDMWHDTIKVRLNRFFFKISPEVTMSQQAFSKLRNNFNHYPFEAMHRAVVAEEYSECDKLDKRDGYLVFAVDGSYLQLPDNAATRKEFGVRGAGKRASAGVSVLFDVLHGWALNPIITRSEMNEREALKNHLDWIAENIPNGTKTMILLDRGYPSAEIIGRIEAAGVKYLMRCKRDFSKSVESAPMGASTVTIDDHQVQVHKLLLPGGEVETLLTNLTEYDSATIGELYRLRWGVETLYNQLKNTVCLENFSGKTPNSIRQDFWVSMVLINSIAVFKNEADAKVREEKASKNQKHTYQSRTSDMVVTLRDRFIFVSLLSMSGGGDYSEEMNDIISVLAASSSPIRPGRSFERKPKPYRAFNLYHKSHL